tara:strand:- start:148 stop:1185 length:1038 start_codon:yes stop_codon:yes gene_type:complete
MTKKNEMNVTASSAFTTAPTIGKDVAQATLRNSLKTLEKSKDKVNNWTQVSAIALARLVHCNSDNGLDLVPSRVELADVLQGQIEAIAVHDDGTKDDALAGSLKRTGKIICQMTWGILAGHFFVGYCGNPSAKKYTYFKGQEKDGWKPNPNIHTEKVFKKANAIFPKGKDSSGNLNTLSPNDIHPVTNGDAEDCYKMHMLRADLNADYTGFAPKERASKVETISTAKEAKIATLGLISWFKNQAFVDGKVCADLWDNEELDTLVRSSLFDTLLDLKDEVIKAKTVADAMQAEESLKAKEAEESAKLKAEINAKLAENFDKIEDELEAEIAESNAKSTKKSKAKVA